LVKAKMQAAERVELVANWNRKTLEIGKLAEAVHAVRNTGIPDEEKDAIISTLLRHQTAHKEEAAALKDRIPPEPRTVKAVKICAHCVGEAHYQVRMLVKDRYGWRNDFARNSDIHLKTLADAVDAIVTMTEKLRKSTVYSYRILYDVTPIFEPGLIAAGLLKGKKVKK